jgi:hypothetical protein
MRIQDPGWKKYGSGMEKSRIRNKHPGSTTLKGFGFCQNSVEFLNSFSLFYSPSWADQLVASEPALSLQYINDGSGVDLLGENKEHSLALKEDVSILTSALDFDSDPPISGTGNFRNRINKFFSCRKIQIYFLPASTMECIKVCELEETTK